MGSSVENQAFRASGKGGNGGQILSEFVSSVEMLEYSDSLEVTEPEDMLDYVYSLTGMTGISSIRQDVLKRFCSRIG